MAQKGNEIHTRVHHKELLSDIFREGEVCPAKMDGMGAYHSYEVQAEQAFSHLEVDHITSLHLTLSREA